MLHARTVTATQEPAPFAAAALGVAVLVAAALSLNGITRGLEYDELFTAVNFVDQPTLWGTVSSYRVFNNHLAFSVLARFSQAVLGRSEWVLRFPALVLGVACIPAAWVLGRRLFNPVVASAAAWTLALNPTHVHWSHTARGYTGFSFFALISTLAFFKLLEKPTGRIAIVYALASFAGAYFHLYYVFVGFAQIVVLLLQQTRSFQRLGWASHAAAARHVLLGLGGGAALSTVAYLPVTGDLLHWVAVRGRSPFRVWFPVEVLQELWHPRLWPIVLAAALTGAIASWRRNSRFTAYTAVLIGLPTLTMWIVSPRDLFPRFFSFALPYMAILVGAGVVAVVRTSRAASNHVRVAASCAIVVGVLALSSVWTRAALKVPEEGYRAATKRLVDGVPENVGLCGLGGGVELVNYYTSRTVWGFRSAEQFASFVGHFREIRCIYRQYAGWETTLDGSISRWLDQNASRESVGGFVIYTLRK